MIKSNQEILQKALEKAVRNGFKGDYPDKCKRCEAYSCESEGDCVFTTIFNKDFAKAFWGKDKEVCSGCGKPWEEACWCDRYYMDSLKLWRYYLQQMVISEDPIKYLEQFIA